MSEMTELKKKMDQVGYVEIPNLLKDEQRLRLLKHLRTFIYQGTSNRIWPDAAFQLWREDKERYKNILKQIQYMPALYDSRITEPIFQLLQHQLGFQLPVYTTRPIIRIDHPALAEHLHYHKTPPHQDWPSLGGSLDSVTVWVALNDLTVDKGRLGVYPRSHKQRFPVHRTVGGFYTTNINEPVVHLEAKAGDAIIFSSFLVHESGYNRSDAPRISLQYRIGNMADVYLKHHGFRKHYDHAHQPNFTWPTEKQLQGV